MRISIYWRIRVSGLRRKRFLGVQGYGKPGSGSWGRGPQTQEEFLNFAKIVRKLKNIILAYLSQKFGSPALTLRSFWRKTQRFEEISRKSWWKCKRKIEFLRIFLNFVAKNRSLRTNILFTPTIYSAWGGGRNPHEPLRTPLRRAIEVQTFPGVGKIVVEIDVLASS